MRLLVALYPITRFYLAYTDHQLDGRQQAACCSVTIAPVTPATCSYDLCRTPGFCTNDGTSGIASNKRDLEKRGQDHYQADIGTGITLVIIAMVVDAIGSLFAGRNQGQVIRTQFVLRPTNCIAPAIDLLPIGLGSNPPGLTGDQTEHPLEVSTFPSPAATYTNTNPNSHNSRSAS